MIGKTVITIIAALIMIHIRAIVITVRKTALRRDPCQGNGGFLKRNKTTLHTGIIKAASLFLVAIILLIDAFSTTPGSLIVPACLVWFVGELIRIILMEK